MCCNACSDKTVDIARDFGDPVRVVESDVPSKTNAMNMGDTAARGFPRVYVDADVVMSLASVRALAKALEKDGVRAVAPAVETVYPPGTIWSVRAYYDFWMALPYIQEGMMAAGVYAMNEAGRAFFGRFPDVISDDGFVRLQFSQTERIEVDAALSVVSAPAKLDDLIKIKTRSRLGVYELMTRFPDHYSREAGTKQYGKAIMALARKPRLYLAAIPYLWVNVISRLRARNQRRTPGKYVWERDNSSRVPSTNGKV